MIEAFFSTENGEDAVDKVRFAIGTEHGLQSFEWSATAANKSGDLFLSTRGLARDIKVTFHKRHAVVAFLAERAAEHRSRGILGSGESRQKTMVPVQPDGCWTAAHIDFVEGTLIPPDRPHPVRPGKPIFLLAPPPPGHMRRIFVVHSYGRIGELQLEGHNFQHFARLQSADRNLTFFTAVLPIDERERRALQSLVQRIPHCAEAIPVADEGNLAAVFWDNEGNTLTFCEVHNIVVNRPAA